MDREKNVKEGFKEDKGKKIQIFLGGINDMMQRQKEREGGSVHVEQGYKKFGR